MSQFDDLRKMYPQYANVSDEQFASFLAVPAPVSPVESDSEQAPVGWLRGTANIFGASSKDALANTLEGVSQLVRSESSDWAAQLRDSADSTRSRLPEERLQRMYEAGFRKDSKNTVGGLFDATVGGLGSLSVILPTTAAAALAAPKTGGASLAIPLAATTSVLTPMLAGSAYTTAVEELNQITPEQLMQSPDFRNYFRAALSDIEDPEAAFQSARKKLTDDLAEEALMAGAAAGAGSSLVVGPLLSRFIGGATAGSIPKSILRGAQIEGIEETFQSGTEAFAREHAKSVATGQPLDVNTALRDTAFGTAIGAAAGGVIGAPAGLRSPVQQANEIVEDARRSVADQGGDALDQELAASEIHSAVMPDAVMGEMEQASRIDTDLTARIADIDSLTRIATELGAAEEAADLQVARRYFQRAMDAYKAGDTQAAQEFIRSAEGMIQRATVTTERALEGTLVGGEIIPSLSAAQLGDVFDQSPDPAQLNGTRGLLNDAGVIYGQEPSEITTARQQRQADNFSAFYGQEGTAQFRSDVVTGELDRSSELPPAPERSALPPGTGQIDLGRDRSERTFTPISSEYPGVGRNVIERQSQAAPALPQGNTARSITQAQMIDLQDQYRQAIRVPVRDRTPEQKQAVETINAVRSGDIAVVESPPATSSVVDTEAAVEAPQMPLRPLTAEDAQVDSFDLTGSNRTADTEAAQGQGDLLGIWQSKPDLNTNPDTAAVSKRLPDRYNLVLQEKGPFKGGWRVIGPDGFMGAIRKDQVEAVNWAIDQISKIEEGKKNAAAEKQAQESLAEKIKKGDKPSSRDWQNAGLADAYQLNRGYVYQSDISQFLVKHFGIPKNNIRNNIGKASGVVRSDMGNETPIVYLGRLHEVFRQSEQRSSKAKQTQQPLQIEQHAEQPATQQAELTNAPEPTEPAVIEDVGEKLGRARKDELRTARERLGNMDDEQIASTTLSKLWPKSELDKIEDPVSAAIYHTARNMVPNKPRIGYKLKRWVDQVKQARDLLNMVDEIGSDKFIQAIRDKGIYSLQSFADKVELLTGVDRSHWDRIGRVEKASGAYREGEEMVSGSWMLVEIDKRMTIHRGASEVSEIISPVNAHLEKSANEQPVMKFEIRHDRRHTVYQINKTGDNEQRPLKTFDTLKEARDYLRNNNADLVEAWEAVKQRDNVTKADMRSDNNRDRTGQDYRGGKDVSAEEFIETFGFRGAEFGNWVKQGKAGQERQGLLNDAYDAFMDLANVLGLPPKALSFEGRLGIGFGSRGRGGRNAAHYEPDLTIISLTKTKGAGSLAHEWFHALDNYFSRKRGDTEFNGDQKAYREGAFVTYRPEPMMAYKPSMKGGRAPYLITKAEYNRRKERGMGFEESRWIADPDHPKGIRPEVEKEFAELVNTLNASPMLTRSQVIDKGKVDGYWSQIIERAARSFETHIIAKLAQKGYRNDFLANVTSFEKFKRDPGRYPYLKPDEQGPVSEAFDKLFSTIETKETDSGVAMFSRTKGADSALSRDQVEAAASRITADWSNAPEMVTVASDLNLPADLQSAIEAQNARGKIDGVFHKGKFYLVADKIRTEADVERIVLHEALGHYGLRQLYGPALGMHMDRLFSRVGGYKGIQRLGKKYGFDLSSYWENPGDMSIAQRREMMADELVAHIAGTGTVEPDLIQQIAHLIREGLRKMMAGTRFADRLNQMTDVEVLRIVAAARQAVTKGESRITMLTHDPRFVREFEKVVYGEKSLADDARFSRTDKTAIDYEQRIDDLFAGAPSNRKGIKVLDRADVLDLLGHGDKPLHLAESAVRKKENGTVKHKMTAADWKRVPSWIENPVAVFRSQTSPNRLVLFAPDLVDGRPVRVILQPNSTLGQMDVHLTINAYEEGGQHITPVDKWVKNGDLLYLDQEKSPAFSERSGLRLPKDVRQLRGYPRIVVTESELVKYREENPDTRFSRVADDNYDHSIERKTGSNAHLISKKGALEPAEVNDTASNLSIASESESSTVAVPLSNEDLRAGIRTILPDFEDGDNRATIVNSFDGLPDVVKQEAKNQGSNGDDVEGVFHNGTIYVVADKITSVGQLETLLFHEGTHGGVNALYADEGVSRAMNRLYAAMGGSTGFNKVVDQLGIRNKIEPYIKGTLQRNTDGRVAMPRELRNTILMQEVLAYTGEKGSKSFQLRLRELVGAVRNWLREHGFLNLAELGVTDIAYTARRARESGLSNLGRDGISYFRFSDKVHKMFKSDQSSFVTDSPAITPRWKEFTKLRAVWDSASDVLRRTDATRPVADAIDRFYDQTREHMGTVNTIIDPIAEKLRKTGKADRNAALKAFEQYMADRENGRKPSMNDLPDLAQEMVNAWAEVADVTGTINQASGVKVFDAKIGKWRDIGKIGEFWPRKLKKEIQNALLFPNKHDATWRQMAQALFNDGRITENSYQAASEYLGNELSKLPTDSQNDYFAGVEKARGLALPEAFYDYSWDAGMQYKDQWAEATSRIQALGQRAVMGTDLIDQVAAKVTDKETLNYLKAVQDRMYNTMPNDSYVRGATIMNTLATGLQLGNPATALLNLIGGTALNFQAYGFNRSIRALGTELTGLSKEIKEARQIGILIDDYLMLQQDSAQAGMGEKLQGFTTGMLKWGGYTPMETFIRTHGYVVAKTMLRDSLSSWKQNIESKKSLKLLAWYQRNGFDTDKLIAENGDGPETRRLYRKQVNLTQGSYRIDQTPVFVDSPIGKFLFKYQKFGTQLSRLFWINHLKPFIDSITKGGETVTYTKNGKQYSARVRNFMPMLNFFGAAVVAGTALAALREAIFGYNDPGPDLDEIEKALADDDTAYAVALGMKRAWASLMAVGALGFFGNYAQMVRDVSDRQRVKSPIDPPALAPIKNTGEMALRFFDQKTLTAKDFDEYLSGMFSLYRTGKRASLNMLAGSVDLDIAQLEAANRDRSYIRKITRRYADDIGLENRRRAPSSIARTEMSPANRALIDAALLGDSERMKVIVRDQLRKANSPHDVDRMMTSMRAALRAAQPARVSISPSERERQDFLEWAKDRLPEASYARIFDLENRYTQAAIAAGLMQPPNRRQVMRDRIRTARNSVEFSTDRARELYIRREIGI